MRRIKGTIISAIKKNLPISVIFALLLFFGADWISIHVFHDANLTPILRIFSIAVPFLVLARDLLSATVGFQEMRYNVYTENIFKEVLKLGAIVILVTLGFGVIGAAWCWVLAIVLMPFMAFYFLEKKVFPIFNMKIKAISKSVGAIVNISVLLPLSLYLVIKLMLIALYIKFPQRLSPFWAAIAPGISAEDLSHYPFSLLNMAAILGNLDILLDIFLLVIPEAMTITLLYHFLTGSPKSSGLGKSMRNSLKRYPSLIIASGFSTIIILAFSRILSTIFSAIISGTTKSQLLGIGLTLFIQPFFIYIIPFIIVDGKGIGESIKQSFLLGKSIYIESLTIIFLSFLITTPVHHLAVVLLQLRSANNFHVHTSQRHAHQLLDTPNVHRNTFANRTDWKV